MKYIFTVCCILFLVGCTNVSIQTTKKWEGHCMTVEDFKSATSNIALEADESIWVLSNRTLKRVLKNTEK
jgi:hypothetical protein